MAALNGLTSRMSFVTPPGGAPTRPMNVPAGEPASQPQTPATAVPAVIDGTPVRVAVIALSAAGGLIALRMAGFRFNVGVSN